MALVKMDYKLLFNSSIEALNNFDAKEQGIHEYLDDFLASRWKVNHADQFRLKEVKLFLTSFPE